MSKSKKHKVQWSRVCALIGFCVCLSVAIVACGSKGDNDKLGSPKNVSDAVPVAESPGEENDEAGSSEAATAADAKPSDSGDSGGEVTAIPISFKVQIAPIFNAKCIDCHHARNAVKVDFTNVFDSEVGLINRPNSWPESSRPVLIVPGDPDASALMLKIEATELDSHVEGELMPWAIPRLTGTELVALRSWIEGGAQDDEQYRSSVRRIFGDGVSLGSRGGKCAYCHYPESPTRPDLTQPFDLENGAVGVASDRGGIRIAPGDPESSVLYLRVNPEKIPMRLEPLMPNHYERVTVAEAAIIRRWISEGALNN